MRRSSSSSASSPHKRLHQIGDGVTSLNKTDDRSNFYINPKEILEYFEDHPSLFQDDNFQILDLNKVKEWLENLKNANQRKYVNFWNGSRKEVGFLGNEFRKFLFAEKNEDILRHVWMFPYLSKQDDAYFLAISSRDVFDLPLYIMFYILYMLAFHSHPNESYHLAYIIGSSTDDVQNIIYNDNNRYPIVVRDGTIREADLETVYMTLIRHFASLLPEGDATWNGSEDSGTRIIIHDLINGGEVYISLVLIPTMKVYRAHGWTQAVENLLLETAGNTVISVRNKEDNKCLIYCLIMGLIIKIKGFSRVFGTHNIMVDSTEVYAKGMYLFTDDSSVTKCIQTLARLLLPPIYSTGEPDPLVSFVENIDKKAGTSLSISEFRKEFAEIESKLIPSTICGIDVYGIDFNINPHIYPLYISKTRHTTLELLCVTPLDTRCSHYALIINREILFRGTGGKQFFSCSKCGKCFFHRRLLFEHDCPFKPQKDLVDGEGGYHYSRKGIDPSVDLICGSCSKCRLCFVDEFTYEYHKTHCFMNGRTGYRHVQLISYDVNEHPTLKGEDFDLEQEEKYILSRRVLYADFESTIDSTTGDHSFMSYGIYDWDTNQYECGYDLHNFIEFILNKAFENEKDKIYVYFHNAMGYDANFILRYILAKPEYVNWGIQVIMKSMNRLQKLVFHVKRGDKTRMIYIGDTFLFLTLSLERIVGSIRKDDITENKINFERFFNLFHERYPDVPENMIDHILRKNIFPYRFFDNASKLDTSIEMFLQIFEPEESNLRYFSERVTLSDLQKNYSDTVNVIKTFHCQNARDYHDLYLCCDVLQLADVFNRSMDILWESHHIHLTKYLGMPSASWAAFLRFDPNMEIPLYEDTFYAEFFKGMIRGGITSAALRYAKSDERHSIIYLDVNGLYPYVMQAYKFPCGKFNFVPLGWTRELARIKLYEYFDKFERENKGMCFCADLIIPDDVKYRTDMYPFAPEHRRIFREYYEDFDSRELTPFLKKWKEANDGETMSEFTGLVCTLYNKEKYNVHWRLLKFYMEHGVIVDKVYFGVSFDEGDYLAGYIRKNISIRNTRKDELGKTLYKLLGNSIYGKTFESPFKRNTFEIVRDKTKLQGLLEEGNIAAITPIDDLGWIVRMDGEDIILDKPTYIGACVCEFAKLHMYTLLYDKLMKIFPGNSDEIGCQLVYTDTDSFIVKVLHPDSIGSSTQDLFDYIKKCDPSLIGGIGGQVKSETGEDDTIEEIIALRSKVYAYITKSGHIGKRAKGTTYDAQEMQLDWDSYKTALETLTSLDTRNAQFVRKTFHIASVDIFRRSLSVNDGKRYICADGIHTHAFGYPNL